MTQLLVEIERSLQGGAWYGPSLQEALEGVDLQMAVAKRAPDVHSIADLVWHLTGWMEVVAARLRGENPLGPERGNFPEGEPDSEAEWARWRELPARAMAELKDALQAFPAERLSEPAPYGGEGRIPTYGETVNGIAQHNAYHVGQIVLVRKGFRKP